MSNKLQNFLHKTARHAVISHALAERAAEEIAVHELSKKAAMDEVQPTVDALIKIGAVKPEHRKTACASLASHADALVKLRKLAEMVGNGVDSQTVGGPGKAMPKTAGDRRSIQTTRDEANDEFVASL